MRGRGRRETTAQSSALGLDLGDPTRDDTGGRSRLERCPVTAQPLVTLRELPSDLVPQRVDISLLHVMQGAQSAIDPVRLEEPGQPPVQGLPHLVLGQVRVRGMLDPVGQRVLLRVAAPVVRALVVPLTLHPPVADPAPDHPAQDVRPLHPLTVAWLGPTATGEQLLSALRRSARRPARGGPAVGSRPSSPAGVP